MSAAVYRRRALLKAVGAAFLGARTSRAAVESNRTPLRVTVALAARQSLYQLPLTLAEQLGYFKQAGLAVEWQSHEAGAKAVSSALQGQADVVGGAFEHLFGLHEKGLNYQAFVLLGRTPQVSFGVATHKDLRSVLALKGARVGVSALDSSTHWMACQWLLQNGLLPEDVTFVEVGSSFGVIDALRSGNIDALCNLDPIMYGLEQKNEIRLLGEARTLAATRKVMGGSVPGASLFARAEFLQQQPAVVQALTDGVVHALKWLQTAGLTDILKAVPSHHWMGDRAMYLGAFEKLRESYAVDGLIPQEGVFNAWRAHSRLPGMVHSSRLPRAYTNVFAVKAKERFEL
ncbi:ABC transporter substrate-binding protein [Limnohabitans sp. T6-5]|uniref:ABC transporter substrate-binding protein n=1 Tax=Limnohabitans sp. T6-5 TaxID=1100724 RepID=UPI001E4D5834|nr:ABC transporter substrate-binding protein [Limnohabitans sp. T6-5]